MSRLKIISGGQTGADRGGLDAAIQCGIEHGGFCPKDRRAEDGVIPFEYALIETPTTSYDSRTEWNVSTGDATILFYIGFMTPGTRATMMHCSRYRRPCFPVNLPAIQNDNEATTVAAQIVMWLRPILWTKRMQEPHTILNVAGSRESKAHGIQARVTNIMQAVIGLLVTDGSITKVEMGDPIHARDF